MTEQNYDLIVVGGGPGGYVAAIRAAQLGMTVAQVEARHLGGVCLNWGCIPTKALLRVSELYHTMKRASEFGLEVKDLSFDLQKIVQRSRDVASQLSKGVQGLLKKNKVTVIDGYGKLLGKGKLRVEQDGKEIATLTGKHIILATGARSRVLPGLEPDGQFVWTAKEAMIPEKMPERLLVVGSGAIGIEFASFYRMLGAEVTVVELMDRILPVEDAEISAFVRKELEKQGMKILTESKVAKLDKSKTNVKAAIEGKDGKTQEDVFDHVISAVGIVGNVDNIGLENTNVKTDRTHIVTNEWCATDEPGIYAIGDVAGPPWLAHKASHEGVLCVEKIAGLKGLHPIDPLSIPGCTYCTPQVASVGLTEEKARSAGYSVKVGRFPSIGNGKAIAMGETNGLVKTIFDAKTGELLGAHMAGAEVTELIQGFGIARTLETTEQELMHTVFAHPTLSEMMHESVLAAYGRAIHV